MTKRLSLTTTEAGQAAAAVTPATPGDPPPAPWCVSLYTAVTTPVAVAAAAGAGLKNYITGLQAINTGSIADLIILDGAAERWRIPLPTGFPVVVTFPTPLLVTANTALNANLGSAAPVRLNAQGYTAA